MKQLGEFRKRAVMIFSDILKLTAAGVMLTAALSMPTCTKAHAQTVYYTGPQWQPLGYSQTIGNTTYYTGAQGQAQGYSQVLPYPTPSQPVQTIQSPPLQPMNPPPITRPSGQVAPTWGAR